MNEFIINKEDEIVMKLLCYFITKENYNPIILHGVKDEIWLENQSAHYKIIRLVTNYIHNDEQFNYDVFKTKQIIKKINKKTFNFSSTNLSIFLNLGDNVHAINANQNYGNIICANVKKEKDLTKCNDIMSFFPNIIEDMHYDEKGLDLFVKLTNQINQKSEKNAIEASDVFAIKKPIITYILLVINALIFILMYLTNSDAIIYKYGLIREFVQDGEYYRLFTSMFIHHDFLHLIFNSYALYVIGPQIESFYGKTKYLIIYLLSGLFGSLLSMIFLEGISVGASGAIFGLLGSLLYFGYHYRVYLGGVMKSQIIPLILINLIIGFLTPEIDNAAHIGGLIGGILISMACGVKYKSEKYEIINGFILSIIFGVFLIYFGFLRG